MTKPDDDKPKQPSICKGCVWGRWTEVKQVCGMPRCVRERPLVRKY